jgi:sigma-B regulation protein RsbU (phosphoserine phosphatase)
MAFVTLTASRLDQIIELSGNLVISLVIVAFYPVFTIIFIFEVFHIISAMDHSSRIVKAEMKLDEAGKIQQSILPRSFPTFPNRPGFDIYASMQPAKEVGGDFYDYFSINENTFAIVMADVSGKGVSAALFMAIAKTRIRVNAFSGKSPDEVFEEVNNFLCEDNEICMFVTAFLGYLNVSSGEFSYVNAGHNLPLFRSDSGTPIDGGFEWLEAEPGFVLAGMKDVSYKLHRITLSEGDELFIYTDGVTEAANRQNELFGERRLLEAVNRYTSMPLKEFTISIKDEIDKFADGEGQTDDITMLALRL